MTPRDRRARVRDLARLATVLATKVYKRPGDAGTVFEPCDLKAFRAAFVEVEFENPFQVIDSESRVDFSVCGTPYGHIGSDGAVRLTPRRDSKLPPFLLPHVLSPSNLHALADRAYQDIHRELCAAYERRTGHTLTFVDQRGGYFHSRIRRLKALATNAVRRFCSRMAPDRLAVLRHAQLASLKHAVMVEFVTGPYGPEWTQAIRAYPALINWSFDPTTPRNIVEAVQSRKPLVPALAAHYGISETQVRRFRGLTPQRCTYQPGQDALHMIIDLPPHLRPVTRRDWKAALELHGHLTTAFISVKPFQANGRFSPATLFRGIKTPLGKLEGIGCIRNLADPVASIVHAGAPSKELLQRLMQMSVMQMVAFNADWHRESDRVTRLAQAEAVETTSLEGWPGALPCPVVHLAGGVEVTELLTPVQLIDEGVVQHHCVASYVGNCYAGRCRILSLRCKRTGARTTAELVKVSPNKIEVAQHTGVSNDPAPPEMDRALRNLVRELNSGEKKAWPRLDDPTAVASWASIQQRMRPWLLKRLGISEE